MNLELITQSVIAMLVITSPPDPAKVLLFNSIVEENKSSRSAAALKVATIVFSILAGAAIGGAEAAKLLGMLLGGLKRYFEA